MPVFTYFSNFVVIKRGVTQVFSMYLVDHKLSLSLMLMDFNLSIHSGLYLI